MRYGFLRLGLIVVLFATALAACSKDPVSTSKLVKYEITGNFTGKLTVTYTDNTGATSLLQNVSLPWSKEVSYPASVLSVGVGAQATVLGTAGQTASMKIYYKNAAVKSTSATAGSLGELVLPAIAHVF